MRIQYLSDKRQEEKPLGQRKLNLAWIMLDDVCNGTIELEIVFSSLLLINHINKLVDTHQISVSSGVSRRMQRH